MNRYLRTLIEPRPTLFDLLAGGLLLLPVIRDEFARSLGIVFYSFFLYLVSYPLKPNRSYNSLPLTLLGLWSLLGIFIHSFVIISPESTFFKYLNFYMAIEGFLYLFAGILFLKTVINYSTNLNYVFLLFPLAIIPWYEGLFRVGSTTPIVAGGVSVIIYLFIIKQTFLAWILALGSLILTAAHWTWICMKFSCRPFIWGQLLKNSFYHPVRSDSESIIDVGVVLAPGFEQWCIHHFQNFENLKPWLASIFGSGFVDSINGMYTWVDRDLFGWVYRQNDYLALSEYLGPIVLVLLFWFVYQTLRLVWKTPLSIWIMGIALTCFFQATMFEPGKAGLCLLIIGATISEGLRRKYEKGFDLSGIS